MTIPANEIVNVIPGVLPTGGDAIDVTGLVLTTNTRPPIGSVLEFNSQPEVADFFGPTSHQAAFASVYFAGFANSTALPGAILYAQYPLAAVSAYLRGGDLSSLSLATLQGYSGTLTVTIDGTPQSQSVSLSSATSFSNAAEIIGQTLDIHGVQTAVATSVSLSGTVMTVNSGVTGTFAVGNVVSGTGLTAGTYIASLGTGTGGAGTYNLSTSATTESNETVTAYAPGCYYDGVSGAFIIQSGTTGGSSTVTYGSGALATDLLLTQATGAVLSQGAVAATPTAFMGALLAVNSAWVTFTTDFDPDGGSGNTQKQAFAAWNATQDDSYAYVAWDTDTTPTTQLPATTSLGYILQNNGNSGTSLNWEPGDQYLAAFVMGAAASINFAEQNGRITFAGKMQAGLTAGVTTASVAENLGGNPQVADSFGNGYNFYGAYAQANNNFIWYQRGTVTGPYGFLDSYIDQIWLNASLQNAVLNLFATTKSVPFTTPGATMIENAMADPIAAGLNFGAFGPGSLTASQISALNTAAGVQAANSVQSQGYYVQIVAPSAAVKSSRGPWQVNFFYLDNGSVQSITLSSTAVVG